MSGQGSEAFRQRRQFLNSLLALPAFAVGAATVGYGSMLPAAGESDSGISLGFSLYGTKQLTLEESMLACSAAGFRHVEFCLNPGFPTEPAVFDAAARRTTAARLRELHLTLPCLMIQIPLVCDDAGQQESLRTIAEAAALGRDLVPDQPPILETVVGGSPAKWDEQKAGMLQRLKGWAELAEREQVVLAIKAHVGSAMNSPARLLWLLQECGSAAIQAAYDFSHFELQGLQLQPTLTELLPRTRFIHVKDTAGDAAKFRFLLPGEGRTDYVQYFRLLRQLKYSGPVCVEVSGQVSGQPGYDARKAITSTWAVLSKALAESAG
jgi:sugar phosphate isomerase/epimerase